MKKAQGISLNVVIVALIAIIVLVVLIVIFSGRTKFFGETIQTCESKGGSCRADTNDNGQCPTGYIKQLGTDCESRDPNTPLCCTAFD